MTTTILIISNSLQTLRLNSLLLKKAGYLVRTEQDPLTGLNILLHNDVELLLLDIDIPDFDAYQFLRKMIDHKRDTLSLVFSKRSKSKINEQYTRYFLYLTFGFLFSPYTRGELLNRCEQVLSTKRALDINPWIY